MRELIIIGSGPAGYTAALYAARANLKPLVFTGFTQEHLQGGQLMTTTEVENYPGFPEGIMGPELMKRMEEQCVRFGTEIVAAEVDSCDLSKRPFTLTADGQTYQAKALIIATGASAKYLDAPGVQEFRNRGVTACATCDGALPKFRNQPVGVAGGGDTAMEEATFLTRFASQVHIINRSEKFRASPIMLAKAKANPKITIHSSSQIARCEGEKGAKGLKAVVLKKPGGEETLPLEGLFMAIGHVPNTEFLKGQLEVDATGYIVTKGRGSQTSVEGVFACGDVQDHVYRQAVTAAGSGCMAALDAQRWLESHDS
ncbi:MAG: thioredoxin-disulfide reductase [Planctomycetota bacterium]